MVSSGDCKDQEMRNAAHVGSIDSQFGAPAVGLVPRPREVRPRDSLLSCTATVFGNISNINRRKGHPAVAGTLECNKRTSVNFLSRVANERSPCPTIQINVRRASGALHPLPSSSAR